MATAQAQMDTKWWSGGKSPFNVEYGKLMMWYFLMSDAFTFGAFLISYGTISFSQIYWYFPGVIFKSMRLLVAEVATHCKTPSSFTTQLIL